MKAEDWQIVVIARSYVDEVDCNTGARRRIFNDGYIVRLS